MAYWRLWCPVCRRYRTSRIPTTVPTSAVTAAYDAHLRRHQAHRDEGVR